jgi:hypothetical protein
LRVDIQRLTDKARDIHYRYYFRFRARICVPPKLRELIADHQRLDL